MLFDFLTLRIHCLCVQHTQLPEVHLCLTDATFLFLVCGLGLRETHNAASIRRWGAKLSSNVRAKHRLVDRPVLPELRGSD